MKLNWGHYIVITFTAFVLLIGFMVYRSFQHNNDLVADDYYAKELQFQDVIDRQKRANDLEQNITWERAEDGLPMGLVAPVAELWFEAIMEGYYDGV